MSKNSKYLLIGLGFVGLFAVVQIVLTTPIDTNLIRADILSVGSSRSPHRLGMYVVRGDAEQLGLLPGLGIDTLKGDLRMVGKKYEVTVVINDDQKRILVNKNYKVLPKLDNKGQNARKQAALQFDGGYRVWKQYDGPDGIEALLHQIADDPQNAGLVQLEVIGQSLQGRDIIALRVTDSSVGGELAVEQRPSVLFNTLIHAREWIVGEAGLRNLADLIDDYHNDVDGVRGLLSTTQVWFVPVMNPDGYQYTFEGERLQRKNMRDTDGDGTFEPGEGVDLNRNFASQWGRNAEGSSGDPFAETYRGATPNSEPETQALQGLIDRIQPKLFSDTHTYINGLFYPSSGPDTTLPIDYPIYVALTGTFENPAMPGVERVMPIGESDSHGLLADAAEEAGAISILPETGEGETGEVFIFADDEQEIQNEYLRLKPLYRAMMKSAVDPENPVSVTGLSTPAFVLNAKNLDGQLAFMTSLDFDFDVSYGGNQEVRVLAKRSLGAVTAKFKINGGGAQSRATAEWAGGDTYGTRANNYYAVMTANVSGAVMGDTVEVWFEGGGEVSNSFTYTVANDSSNRVLIIANEDSSGFSLISNVTNGGIIDPPLAWLSYYTDALDALSIGYDIYDVDGRGHTPPHALGVLSHYDAVIWYSGRNMITSEPGWGPDIVFAGGVSQDVQRMHNVIRDFVNEGGRLVYTGTAAGAEATTVPPGLSFFDPYEENLPCFSNFSPTDIFYRCLMLQDRNDLQNNVIEYTLGSGLNIEGVGLSETGGFLPVEGAPGTALEGISYALSGDNAGSDFFQIAQGFITGISLIDFQESGSQGPSFNHLRDQRVAATYVGGASGGYLPHSGGYQAWSQSADEGYKRLSRTVLVPVDGAQLTFWANYNIEQDWDYFIVEAHTVGQDDWTTLPDVNGNTSSSLANSQSCLDGWSDPSGVSLIHPFLARYQTLTRGSCSNVGTTGEWHASTGASRGWTQYSMDLSAYAGTDVELMLSFVTDWGIQQIPGIMLDDIQIVPNDPVAEGFESGFGAWSIAGAPQGSPGNRNDWVRDDGIEFGLGAAIQTDNTLYMGHAFENISTATKRIEVMGALIQFLLP